MSADPKDLRFEVVLDTSLSARDATDYLLGALRRIASRAEVPGLEPLRVVKVSHVSDLTRVDDRNPPPHGEYLVLRGGKWHVCGVCYGMHAPWWVERRLDGSDRDLTPMATDDLWVEVPRS